MSKTVLAEIIVPAVVAVALAVWITMVYWAEKHRRFARTARGSKPRHEVTEGSFQGAGGRQLMPLPGREPAPEAHQHTSGDANAMRNDGYLNPAWPG